MVKPSWTVEAEHDQSCICRSHLHLLIKLHLRLGLGYNLQESDCAAATDLSIIWTYLILETHNGLDKPCMFLQD